MTVNLKSVDGSRDVNTTVDIDETQLTIPIGDVISMSLEKIEGEIRTKLGLEPKTNPVAPVPVVEAKPDPIVEPVTLAPVASVAAAPVAATPAPAAAPPATPAGPVTSMPPVTQPTQAATPAPAPAAEPAPAVKKPKEEGQ